MDGARIRVNLIRQRKKARKKKLIKPRNLFKGLPTLLSRIRDNDELFQIFKEPHKYTEGLQSRLREGAIRELSKRAASIKDESMLHTVATYTQTKRVGLRIVEKIDPEDGLALAFIAEKARHPEVGIAAVDRMPPVMRQLKEIARLASNGLVAGAAADRLWEMKLKGKEIDDEALLLVAAKSTDEDTRGLAALCIKKQRSLAEVLKITKYADARQAIIESAAIRMNEIMDRDLLTQMALHAEDAALGLRALSMREERSSSTGDFHTISRNAVSEKVRKKAERILDKLENELDEKYSRKGIVFGRRNR